MATAIQKRISALEKVSTPAKAHGTVADLLQCYGVTMAQVLEQYGSVGAFAHAKLIQASEFSGWRELLAKHGSASSAYKQMLNR